MSEKSELAAFRDKVKAKFQILQTEKAKLATEVEQARSATAQLKAKAAEKFKVLQAELVKLRRDVADRDEKLNQVKVKTKVYVDQLKQKLAQQTSLRLAAEKQLAEQLEKVGDEDRVSVLKQELAEAEVREKALAAGHAQSESQHAALQEEAKRLQQDLTAEGQTASRISQQEAQAHAALEALQGAHEEAKTAAAAAASGSEKTWLEEQQRQQERMGTLKRELCEVEVREKALAAGQAQSESQHAALHEEVKRLQQDLTAEGQTASRISQQEAQAHAALEALQGAHEEAKTSALSDAESRLAEAAIAHKAELEAWST